MRFGYLPTEALPGPALLPAGVASVVREGLRAGLRPEGVTRREARHAASVDLPPDPSARVGLDAVRTRVFRAVLALPLDTLVEEPALACRWAHEHVRDPDGAWADARHLGGASLALERWAGRGDEVATRFAGDPVARRALAEYLVFHVAELRESIELRAETTEPRTWDAVLRNRLDRLCAPLPSVAQRWRRWLPRLVPGRIDGTPCEAFVLLGEACWAAQLREDMRAEGRARDREAGLSSIREAIEYARACADELGPRTFRYGDIVLCATAHGEAWILSGDGGGAACIGRGGAHLPVSVLECGDRVALRWPNTYTLRSGRLRVTDGAGRTCAVPGAPARALENALGHGVL